MTPTAAPQGSARLDTVLIYRMHKLTKLAERNTNRAYTQEFGLSLGEGRCLAAIGSFQPVSVNDLSRTTNLDKGHASRSAQALVDRGLVRKVVSELDGRGVVLTLTDQGQHLHGDVMTMVLRRNAEVFACLNAQEQGELGAMLGRVIDALRDEHGR